MKLTIVPAALDELESIAAYYTSVATASLARTFMDEFERVVNLVLANPEIGSAYNGRHRHYSLRRFPYRVIYQVTPTELRIIAVAHQRQRPGYWKKRQ